MTMADCGEILAKFAGIGFAAGYILILFVEAANRLKQAVN